MKIVLSKEEVKGIIIDKMEKILPDATIELQAYSENDYAIITEIIKEKNNE